MSKFIMFLLMFLAACVAPIEAEVVGNVGQPITCPDGYTVATCHVGAAGYVPHPADQSAPPTIQVCGDPLYETSHEGTALSWWKVGSAFDSDPAGPWDVPVTLADGVTPNAECGALVIDGLETDPFTPVVDPLDNASENRDYYCHAETYYGVCHFFQVVVAPYRFWFLGAEERYRKLYFDNYGFYPYWSECTLAKPACWPQQ